MMIQHTILRQDASVWPPCRRPLRVTAGCVVRIAVAVLLAVSSVLDAQEDRKGGIRGMVYDADFNMPVPHARVVLSDIGQTVESGDDGSFVIQNLAAGSYTLVISKDEYQRQLLSGVVVTAGQLAELEIRLVGEYTEMEELVVRDLEIAAGADQKELQIRQTSSSIINTVGADAISKAGQSTVAGALRLVSGATVSEGKYAVIRGLGDRYTSTTINGVRLPTADPDKRAVQLDQFPTAMIDSLQVNKAFTPDQQGDSGAGTINIVTRAIPKGGIASFKMSEGERPTVTGRKDFRWNDRTVGRWGEEPERKLDVRSPSIPTWNPRDFNGTVSPKETEIDRVTKSLSPVVGTTQKAPPHDSGWSATAGDAFDIGEGWKAGALYSASYSRKYEGYNGGLKQTYLQSQPPPDGVVLPTSASRESQGVEKILWAHLASVGLTMGDAADIGVTYMYNHAADNYSQESIQDFTVPGMITSYGPSNAVYKEVLDYIERTTATVQEHGRFTIPAFDGVSGPFGSTLKEPEIELMGAHSDSTMNEPDRTQTTANRLDDGESEPLWVGSTISRNWYSIDEESQQFYYNLKVPFKTSSERDGYFKFGQFIDQVHRTFQSDYVGYVYPPPNIVRVDGARTNYDKLINSTYPVDGMNYVNAPTYRGNQPIWNALYQKNLGLLGSPYADAMGTHVAPGTFGDQSPIDYQADQQLNASYYMSVLPVTHWLDIMSGFRFEQASTETKIDVVSVDESDPMLNMVNAYRVSVDPYGNRFISQQRVSESAANVSTNSTDVLPALGLVWKPDDRWFIRANWSKTVARPTFKEITPVVTPVAGTSDYFVGNPELEESHMYNYDLRGEWYPRAGNLVSVGTFKKTIDNVIDRVGVDLLDTQVYVPINYPEARLHGYELEVRQELEPLWPSMRGFSIGANYTRMWSHVQYDQPQIDAVEPYSGAEGRPMMGMPDEIFNLNAAYDNAHGRTISVFYTFIGPSLIAGESVSDSGYTPSLHQESTRTLTLGLTQRFKKHWTLGLMLKRPLDGATSQYYEEPPRPTAPGEPRDPNAKTERWLRSQVRTSSEYSMSVGYAF